MSTQPQPPSCFGIHIIDHAAPDGVWSEVIAGELVIHHPHRYCHCGTRLSRYNQKSVCLLHLAQKSRRQKARKVEKPRVRCSDPGCITTCNKGRTMCSIHLYYKQARERTAMHRALRANCATSGCPRKASPATITGLCWQHSAPARLHEYRAKKKAAAGETTRAYTRRQA